MPDGHQGDRPFTPSPPHPQTSTSPQAFNIPGATNPAGGVARAIGFVRSLSGKAVVLAVVVFGFQALMPAGSKPSDLIGSFHGDTEKAELKAKQSTAAEYERALADAKAAPPANWQMEAEAFRQQQQTIANSLATQETAANVADAACLTSGFVTAIFGDTKDMRNVRDGMQQGCAAAAAIRQNMVQEQAKAARNGSALVPRSTPATGAGSAPLPPVTVPAHSR
jgi:hypothetical protein